jgi:putative thioredoxin
MSYSFDVTAENFANAVIEASHQQPVLVDFWATWCGPCQSMMPVLTQLAEHYQGAFLLAKVEIDQQQALAQQFGVRSVPTVKLFKQGQLVDEFAGALPEGQIREFIDRYIDKASDQAMQQALHQYQLGQSEAALTEMAHILETDPDNQRNKLVYAKVLFKEGRYQEAGQWLDSLPATLSDEHEVSALRAQLEFIQIAETAPDQDTLEQSIHHDASNSEARYQLAIRQLLQGQVESSLEHLMYIVQHDRNYGDDAARKAVLKIFSLLGEENELVPLFRRRLAMALN